MPRLDDYSLRYKGIDGVNKTYDIYTKLLLNFSGANGSQKIIDEIGHAINIYGNTRLDTSVYKFPPSSCCFDGNGDCLRVLDSTDWAFGTGDFTIDCWIYPLILSSGDGSSIISFSNDIGNIEIISGGIISYYDGTLHRSSSGLITTNLWQHFVAMRENNTITFKVNEINVFSFTSSINHGSSARYFAIGSRYSKDQLFYNGYFGKFKIVKGIAR